MLFVWMNGSEVVVVIFVSKMCMFFSLGLPYMYNPTVYNVEMVESQYQTVSKLIHLFLYYFFCVDFCVWYNKKCVFVHFYVSFCTLTMVYALKFNLLLWLLMVHCYTDRERSYRVFDDDFCFSITFVFLKYFENKN